jgi:acyl-CoA synthetase (AMP-forming)/AMP-acid ligase II
MLVHLGLLQERIAQLVPDHDAVVQGDRVWSHAEVAARSRRIANAMRSLGLGCRVERDRLQPWESGQDHVALYLYNGPEWIESMYGVLKARAAFVNVNYRYKAEELHYVLETGAARAIIYHGAFAPTLAAVRDRLPLLRHFIQVDDGSAEPLLAGAIDYEAWVAGASDARPDLPYSADDLYLLYTGGTTGLPKGVLWRQEDVFYNGLGGHLPGFPRLETDEQLRDHVNLGIGGRSLVCLPFMHGAGQWNVFNSFHRGGTVVLPEETRRLDPASVWHAVERHRCDTIMMTGDGVARPLLQGLREGRYDVSSIRIVTSTAAVLSAAVRSELLASLPDGVLLLESLGASEMGLQAMTNDTTSGHSGLPAYPPREGTVLLAGDRGSVLAPGSEEVGWIAFSGHLPLGYLGDPEKTRQTFPVVQGVRYSVGGDRGRWLPDGRLLFLGREAMCINTGGEKVFAEEVERVLKSHPAVDDALVVGTPSERWGQQVTAVVSLRAGAAPPSIEAVRAHCDPHLAGYKLPKALVTAPAIVRSPSGKPDYAWARQFALDALAASIA